MASKLQQLTGQVNSIVSVKQDPAPPRQKQATTLDFSKATPSAAPPPKASDGPALNGKSLTDALNSWQQEQVGQGLIEVADQYEVVFESSAIAEAKVNPPGSSDTSRTTSQNVSTAKQIDPQVNSVNTNSRFRVPGKGMQVVQFIRSVIENSTYISNQALYTVDQTTQETVPNASAPTKTKWFNIDCAAEIIRYDNKRKDYAYKIKYIISEYEISSMLSQYFKDTPFRGAHKSYNYWFTGENNEIIKYEQNYNMLYFLNILSGVIDSKKGVKAANQTGVITSDYRGPNQANRQVVGVAEQSTQGADGSTNNPSSAGAAYLMDPSTMSEIKLTIVGDPAYIFQQEIIGTTSSGNKGNPYAAPGMNQRGYAGFNNDGTINANQGQVNFTISWNRPADYDLQTGLMNVLKYKTNNSGVEDTMPEQNNTYILRKVKSVFSNGKFTQDLDGVIVPEKDEKSADYLKYGSNGVKNQNAGPNSKENNASNPTPTDGKSNPATSDGGIFNDPFGTDDARSIMEVAGTAQSNNKTGDAIIEFSQNLINAPARLFKEIFNTGQPIAKDDSQ